MPFPPPGDLPHSGIEPMSPALADEFFTCPCKGSEAASKNKRMLTMYDTDAQLHCCKLPNFCCEITFIYLLKLFFFDVSHFKSLYWICYNIVSVVSSGLLATRHVGSWLPD